MTPSHEHIQLPFVERINGKLTTEENLREGFEILRHENEELRLENFELKRKMVNVRRAYDFVLALIFLIMSIHNLLQSILEK